LAVKEILTSICPNNVMALIAFYIRGKAAFPYPSPFFGEK